MAYELTKLSFSMTVKECKKLIAEQRREALGKFIVERFFERYFIPINSSDNKHGFAMMAISCLVIENLECFCQGLDETKGIGRGRQVFQSFMARWPEFREFSNGDWFYKNIRCGILHQAETKDGWRIIRKGRLVDMDAKTINANLFMDELKNVVLAYSKQLVVNEDIWKKFCIKMEFIFNNCKSENLRW